MTRSPVPAVARAAVLVTAVLGLAGCVSAASVAPLPPPPATIGLVEPTTPAGGTSPVALPSVPGQTTTTAVALGPGKAGLSGKVTDSSGAAVAGATVEVQRLVGDASATAKVPSGADGSWSLTSILGGRYRVLAFREPNLGMATADVLFLADGQSQTVNLALSGASATPLTSTIVPDPPVVAQSAELVVQTASAGGASAGATFPGATGGAASAGATSAGSPATASVLLVVTGAWTVLTSNPTTTDASGQASWTLICDAIGPQALAVEVNNGPPQSLTLPSCVGLGSTQSTTSSVPRIGGGGPGTSSPRSVP